MTTGLFTDFGRLRRVFRDPFSTAGPVNNPPDPRRGEIGPPPLQAPHSTPLRSVACCALRCGGPISSPFQLHP